jgi:D-serine deaminase-like pyridoxal phosphate-dependent protein
VEVLVEACTGMRRVGQPDATKVAELAERVAALPALSCAGLMCYQGHLSGPAEDWPSLAREESARVSEFIDALRRRGLPPRVVSGGSTPALFHSHLIEGLTEIRPGTYIFYDRNYLLAGACQPHDLAASALVTVVSTAVPGQIVVDGGGKTLAADRNATGADGFGMGLDDPELTVARLSEEHGVLTGPTVSRYRVGDRLRVVPNHACAMMNLHDWVYGIRGDRVEVEWVVAGRGRVQ